MNAKKTAYFMIYCLTGQMIFNKLLIVSIRFSFEHFNITMSKGVVHYQVKIDRF